MAELHVGGELEALGGSDVAVGHKDHVCDGTTGKDRATNELADEVETTLLIRDSHDDADGNEEDGANAKSKQETIPG